MNLIPEMKDVLGDILGASNVSSRDSDLDQHARDQSFHLPVRPSIVVWPENAEQVSAVLQYANQNQIPVTPWGAGTSLEGNPIPVLGGIVLDMTHMNQIKDIRVDDFQVDVQAGVLYKDMNIQLSRVGLFFAPDPGANATIGGMIANNASGTRTLGYGATKDNLFRLQVVLADGTIIQTGSLAGKSSSGYDMLHLFVGSEGTLGVITEATLKLAPIPVKYSAAVASFPDVPSAVNAVSNIVGSGLSPVALEFLDEETVRTLNTAGEFTLKEKPTLLMEFHASMESGLSEGLKAVEGICRDEGCLEFESGLGQAEHARLWKVRHQTYEILVRNNPGASFLIPDVAVPVSKYPQMVESARAAMAENHVHGFLVGHAGDGNLHALLPYIPGDEKSYRTAVKTNAAMVRTAISLGGTATGEHGVGIGKREYMPDEHGASLGIMQKIKAVLDPNGILNPGKIFIS